MFKTAYVLAGGAGSRLKGVTKKPKPLIEINNKPHIVNLLNIGRFDLLLKFVLI